MHVDALHQRQDHVLVLLEHTDRTIGADGMFQDLQHATSRQLAKGKEDREFYLLPEQREQYYDIYRSFSHHGVILKEDILDAGVIGIQQHMKLCLRIGILQSEDNHQQNKIGDDIN